MSIVTIEHGPGDAPPSPLARCRRLVLCGAGLVGVFVLGAGTWAAFAPLESAVVANGTVVSDSHRKTVQHLEGGIIAQILVQDGDTVKEGQTLLRLDDTKARTTLASDQGQLWEARAAEARLIAVRDDQPSIAFPADLLARQGDPTVAQAIAGQRKIFADQHALEASRIGAIQEKISQSGDEIAGYRAEIASDDQRARLLGSEIRDAETLLASGNETKPHLLELQRELADMQGQRGEALASIARANQTIAESNVDILTVKNDDQKQAADDLRDTQRKRHELEEATEEAQAVMARTNVAAPDNGVVTNLQVHTPGGVVSPGEPLMDLVPTADTLVVEARVRPVDIDRLHEGLKADVRLLPYRPRRVPPLAAKVIYVSADQLVDQRTGEAYFSVKLAVDATALKTMPDVEMIPGMPAQAMIRTGTSTVALYALSPIVDSFREAFREKL